MKRFVLIFLFGDEHTKVPEKLIFYSEHAEIWKILCFIKLDENESEFTNMQQISVIEFRLVLP